MKTTITIDTPEDVRLKTTCLCWKRAKDMPSHLRVQQSRCASSETGKTLWYTALFPPATTELRGVVLFIHGINEHSERFFHVFEDLCAQSYGVLAYDLRSHGQSDMDVEGLRAHVEKFQSLIDDTNAFLSFAKREIYPEMGISSPDALPLAVVGYSLGSLVALHTVLSQVHTFKAIVLLAPAIALEWTLSLSIVSFFGGALNQLVPTARIFPAVNDDWVCRDPLVGQDYDADPLATNEVVTVRMGHQTLQFMRALETDERVEDPQSAFCRLPILSIMGSNDKVTNLPRAQQFHTRLANKDKTFVEVDGAYHVLLEDFERETVMQTLVDWLDGRMGT
ncbi:hypothetical protein Poli38472_010715 [Pythium oligandrum]|uniref:Serine aminopeptidase S33 domain-containing protein n=1 Tax=Pythium oligandrum TaxID=41045 RepID=A0A8K1FJC5_PYTOL|nr:hypothetical protein Poli38472_010715 [Pythium oligandrum]|eukprot:TMW61652.1 hypothetical protein Poli38472_010715 [Pythium oligandrum]